MKRLIIALSLGIGVLFSSGAAQAAIISGSLSETIVESRSGGQNFTDYSEDGGGFPNSWSNSSAKSTAPGLTAGIGSRFNSSSGVGGATTWFQVAPTLPTAGGLYEVYATVTGASGALNVTAGVTTTGGTGLPATTDAFSTTGNAGVKPANTWYLVGTLDLDAGVDTPTVRFSENANTGATSRFYADAILFAEVVPEPASMALVCLGLVGACLTYRRRIG